MTPTRTRVRKKMDGQGNVRRIRKNERKRLNVSNTIKIWFVLQRFTFLLPLVVRTSFTFYAHKDFRTTNNIIDSLLWLNQSVFIASGSGSLFFLRLFFTLWVLYPVTSLQPLFHNCVYSRLLLDGKCRKKYKCIVLLEITLFSHSSKMNWIQMHALYCRYWTRNSVHYHDNNDKKKAKLFIVGDEINSHLYGIGINYSVKSTYSFLIIVVDHKHPHSYFMNAWNIK